MATTLLEAAKIALGRDETYKAAVMMLYAEKSPLLAAMPFENISGNALSFNREKTLPDVAFRGLNEAYSESTGELDRITETLAIAGGDLDVDVVLVKTAGANQRTIQESMKVKALSLSLTKKMIKGDVTSSVKEIDGMQVRCTGDQLVSVGSTSGGDPLSLYKLDSIIDAVEDPTHLIMNKTMIRRLSAAARLTTVGGYITYDLDAFGRRVTKYNGLPIIAIDKDETNTDILPFSEVAYGGGTAATSIYCVSFNDTGVVGLQNGTMDVRDLGEIDTKPVYRTRVEWLVTLAVMRERSIGRLWGVSNAAVTA